MPSDLEAERAVFERDIWPGSRGPAHEGLRLDFKQQVSTPREAAIDVAAFMNGDGGTLLYGVKEAMGPDGYRVASGLHLIDTDKTKQQIEDAIDVWLPNAEQRPEIFPLPTGGQSVLVVRVQPSARLVAVKADTAKLEGLVYVGRNSHGKYFMGVEEVERRIQGYAARSVRIRIREFLATTQGAHEPGKPITVRVYSAGHLGANRRDKLLAKEWSAPGCLLDAAGEWAASIRLPHDRNPAKLYPVEVPYELISLAWWQPTHEVDPPGRPAIMISAYLERPTDKRDVVEVTPLMGGE